MPVFIQGSGINIAAGGSLIGGANGLSNATAISTTGSSHASAFGDLVAFANNSGINASDNFTLHGTDFGRITANASTITGSSNSSAYLVNSGGLLNSNLSAGSSASISLLANNKADATAFSIGDQSPDHAVANALINSSVGIDSGDFGIAVGNDSIIGVDQSSESSALAKITIGNASAAADLGRASGILDSKVVIGHTATTQSGSVAKLNSIAETTHGDASAQSGLNTSQAFDNVAIGTSSLSAGHSGLIAAAASSEVAASSVTTRGTAGANASGGNTFAVVDTNLFGSSELNLAASAVLSQTSDAGTVIGPAATANSVFTNVVGIGGGSIVKSGWHADIMVNSASDNYAKARAVNSDGNANALSGIVAGIDSSIIEIAGALFADGLFPLGDVSNISGQTIKGVARTNADSVVTQGRSISNAKASTVFGLNDSTLSLVNILPSRTKGSEGRLISHGHGELSSYASTVIGNASADGSQDVVGVNSSTVTIVANGNFLGAGVGMADVTAHTVFGGANADLASFTSTGIKSHTDNISIGTIGDVEGLAVLRSLAGTSSAGVIATTVGDPVLGTGSATANLDTAIAIGIDAGDATIKIGWQGSVIGTAVLGSATGLRSGTPVSLNSLPGPLSVDSYDVIAAVLGNGLSAAADANNINIIGITSNDSIVSTPNLVGNIMGDSVAGLNVIAVTQNNTSSTARATIGGPGPNEAAIIAGITDTNLLGSPAYTNSVSGRGMGKFNTRASSGGSSTAESHMTAYGIASRNLLPNTAQAHKIIGTAEAVNAVYASSGTNSFANANTSAYGINNYTLNLTSPPPPPLVVASPANISQNYLGAVNASFVPNVWGFAHANSLANANSIQGSATAAAVL